jgi:hypothetical protein
MLAHFTGDIALDNIPSEIIRKFYLKYCTGKGIHNDSLHLYVIFFWHTEYGKFRFYTKLKPA